MLVRRAAATLVALCLMAVAGCDDAGPPAGPAQGSAQGSAADGPSPTTTETSETTETSPDVPYPTYVALGDSYTAAPGVTRTEQETGCLRSDGNYASQVADRLGATLVDVSCVGASTVSLIGAQRVGDRVQPPQFDALAEDTSLVTVGIGGNDLDVFSTLVGTCTQLAQEDPAGSPCRDFMAGAGQQRDLLVEKIGQVGDRVEAALRGVRDRAPQAEVLLVGYPQPVPARGTCSALPLAAGDYPYVRATVVRLNDAMRAAARKAEVGFVDVVGASRGHDICAGPDAWVNGVNTDVLRALAFHPFAAGQQAVADLVMAKLDLP